MNLWLNFKFKKVKHRIFYFALFVLTTIVCFPIKAAIPERPAPPRLVNNLSKEIPDFLSTDEEARLEKKLEDFSNQTSNQIVIVIVDDLEGDEPWHYATELGQKWGVGQNKFDNGVVILIKPTGGQGQRNLFIAVGYGLEGAIPDLTTKQIRENEMYPYFKKGEYYNALDKATDVLMALAKGEYNSDAYAKKHKKETPFAIIIFIIVFVLFAIFRSRKGGGGGVNMGSAGWYILGSALNRRSSGWGGSGFGGGSSGGFGGFGGGGFGGGGSGGNW